jgi:hypothetical protein
MSNAKIPFELSQPTPRRVRAKRSLGFFFAVATILAAIATVLIIYGSNMNLTISIVFAAAADLLIFAILGFVPVLGSRQQRRLLETGGAATAVIVERQKYFTPRYVRPRLFMNLPTVMDKLIAAFGCICPSRFSAADQLPIPRLRQCSPIRRSSTIATIPESTCCIRSIWWQLRNDRGLRDRAPRNVVRLRQ